MGTGNSPTEADSHGPEPLRVVVEPHEAGQRLDVFLHSRLLETSRSRIRAAIGNGNASVDGQPAKPSAKLKAGQRVEFTPAEPPAEGPEPEAIELDILYEDEAIAVVNKPAAMVVHPAKGHWSGTLASALVHRFGSLSQHGGPTRPGIVHRLDRDTTGVIVVARNDAAHANLAAQFEARTVAKQYLAIVVGQPDRDRDIVDHPIGAHPSQREKMALRAGHSTSREALTEYAVDERLGPVALVRAFPKTGRTHQIRLHLLHAGYPILCDKLYSGRASLRENEAQAWLDKRQPKTTTESRVLLDRQALHALALEIDHPQTGERLKFTAPLPADMQGALNFFRGASG
ncbi:MAG: RluA family pseudouridine synthase [Planctomycetota bacterium]